MLAQTIEKIIKDNKASFTVPMAIPIELKCKDIDEIRESIKANISANETYKKNLAEGKEMESLDVLADKQLKLSLAYTILNEGHIQLSNLHENSEIIYIPQWNGTYIITKPVVGAMSPLTITLTYINPAGHVTTWKSNGTYALYKTVAHHLAKHHEKDIPHLDRLLDINFQHELGPDAKKLLNELQKVKLLSSNNKKVPGYGNLISITGDASFLEMQTFTTNGNASPVLFILQYSLEKKQMESVQTIHLPLPVLEVIEQVRQEAMKHMNKEKGETKV